MSFFTSHKHIGAKRSLPTAKHISQLTLVLILMVSASACSKKEKGGIDADLAQQDVAQLYQRGKSALDRGNYNFAIQYFRALEAAYPYGKFTEQAKLDMMFAYNKTAQIEETVEAADNFLKLYPTHKNVDYAYYMKGVASFEKKSGRIENFVKGRAKAVRDPKPYRDSQAAFEELVQRFPNSKYAQDAKQRLVYIRNALADRELSVAQYYFDNDTYVAAVNRCKNIVYSYETSPAVEGALALMEKAYIEMGLTDLAESTREILVNNFPERGTDKQYKKKGSGFLRRLNPFSRG